MNTYRLAVLHKFGELPKAPQPLVLGKSSSRSLLNSSKLSLCRKGIWPNRAPVFMLTKDGKVVADVSSKVKLLLEDEFTDSKSNKPVANRVIYDYEEDDHNRYRVVFQRSQTILDFRFADMVTGFKHILARVANVDGVYLRFSGTVSVERYVGDEKVGQASDWGIWELTYFGHVE